MNKPDGGPAFPCGPVKIGKIQYTNYSGMSLRDYFAGKTLEIYPRNTGYQDNVIAEDCYKMADAMIREREKLK